MTLETHTFGDDGSIPNSRLPVLIGHCNAGSSADLVVVGAYPNGMRWDLRRGDPTEHDEVVTNIARVPLPEQDPAQGANGPLVTLWRENG
jgi:uncharacterized protein YjlB